MQTPFKVLLESLHGTRDGNLPSMQVFPPVDDEQMSRALDLESAAKQRAMAGTSSDDPTEIDIDREIENRGRKGADEYRNQLELYEARIRDAVSAIDLCARIDAEGEGAITGFNARVFSDENHLHVLRKEVAGREKEYNKF